MVDRNERGFTGLPHVQSRVSNGFSRVYRGSAHADNVLTCKKIENLTSSRLPLPLVVVTPRVQRLCALLATWIIETQTISPAGAMGVLRAPDRRDAAGCVRSLVVA